MDTSAFDARIRGADATLEQRRERAEHTERAVRAEAAVFLDGRIRSLVSAQIAEEPDVSKVLGIEGPRKLKQELTDLCGPLSELVEQELCLGCAWTGRLFRTIPAVSDSAERF